MTRRNYGLPPVPRIPLRPEHVMATGTSFGLIVALDIAAILVVVGIIGYLLSVAGVRL